MANSNAGAPGAPAPDAVRRAVKELVNAVGARRAAEELGVPRDTLARIVAGFGVRDGTVALVVARLDGSQLPEAS